VVLSAPVEQVVLPLGAKWHQTGGTVYWVKGTPHLTEKLLRSPPPEIVLVMLINN